MNKKNIFLLFVIFVVLFVIVVYDYSLTLDKKRDDVATSFSSSFNEYEKKFKETSLNLKEEEIEDFINSANASTSEQDVFGVLFDRQDNLEIFKLNYTLHKVLKNDQESVFLLDKSLLEEKVKTIFLSFSFDQIPSSFTLHYNGYSGYIVCEQEKCMISYKKEDLSNQIVHYYTNIVNYDSNANEKVYYVQTVYVDYEYDSDSVSKTLIKTEMNSVDVLYEGEGLFSIEDFSTILSLVEEEKLPVYELHFTFDNKYQYSAILQKQVEE